jgi:site-specific DNA-methyltransferase (cytosine-N4-specific)
MEAIRVGEMQGKEPVFPYFSTDLITLYCGDAKTVIDSLPEKSVDCIVTSPPYYGQRDYGVEAQIGLEKNPNDYIERLIEVFEASRRVLKPTGSVWVNLGDTYWSGKGVPHGADNKQKHRRFARPQDLTGTKPLCVPKQLLLIPHRFAIAMQDRGWIVRNDNVWHKLNPTPDPAEDRSASAHEYMFHFVLSKKYYYNFEAVALPSNGKRDKKPVSSVWTMKSTPSFKKHIAVFPEQLVRIPIQATLPPQGTLLDPFCGSGTALDLAVKLGDSRQAIGIDISGSALQEAHYILTNNKLYGDSKL